MTNRKDREVYDFNCADGWSCLESEIVGECPKCGADVNSDGEAAYGCNWSPVYCKKCGARPCDGSC